MEAGILGQVARRIGGRCECAELATLRAHVARQNEALAAGRPQEAERLLRAHLGGERRCEAVTA